MASAGKYFLDGKFRSYVGIVFSIISIISSAYFLLTIRTSFFVGMAYPFLIFSGTILLVCIGVIARTSNDIKRVNYIIQHRPETIRIEEFPRMKRVFRNLMIIKIIAIALILIGFSCCLASKSNSLLMGVGSGLFIQSILLYGFDHFAVKGCLSYWNFLQRIYKIHQRKLGFQFLPAAKLGNEV